MLTAQFEPEADTDSASGLFAKEFFNNLEMDDAIGVYLPKPSRRFDRLAGFIWKFLPKIYPKRFGKILNILHFFLNTRLKAPTNVLIRNETTMNTVQPVHFVNEESRWWLRLS